jgi:hypothetical protein
MVIARINVIVLLIAMAFFIEQGMYWGFNLMPGSDRELLADGFNLILLALAYQTPRKVI